MIPKSICIVGGMGRMGKLVGRLLQEAGHSFRVADKLTGPISWKDVGACDVVVLAVPIPELDEVAAELGPYTRSDGTIIDIASVKEGPVKSMLKHCKGEVIGSHPLFGPSAGSIRGQVVFVCPNGAGRGLSWYRSIYEQRGATVVEIDPAEHDRLMASVQVLRHLVLLCFGRSLMRTDFDLAANKGQWGPWFSTLIEMLGHQSQQPPELYADIALHNPYTEAVTQGLRSAVGELCALYEGKDRSNLTSLIREISDYVLQAKS